MATFRQDRRDGHHKTHEQWALAVTRPPQSRVAIETTTVRTKAIRITLSHRSNQSRLFRIAVMGACGSKEITGSKRSRDPSRWKAEDTTNEVSDALSRERESQAPSSELTMNAVVAYFNAGGSSDETTTDKCLTGWEDGTVQMQDWRRKATLSTSKLHSRAVNRIVTGTKTRSVISCSRDTTVAITRKWPVDQTESQPIVMSGHSLNVSTIALDDDETTVCSGGRDTQTILWDLTTAQSKSKNTTAQNVITCSKWVPRERVIAQGSEDLSVKLWDEKNGLRAPVQALRGYVYFPLCLDISSDGLYIVTSSKGFNGVGCEVRVWDRRTGRQLIQYEGHQQDATACCFLDPKLPNSSQEAEKFPVVASASKDGTVKIWDVTSTQVLSEAHEPSGGMFTSISWAGGVLLAGTLHGVVHAVEVDAITSTLKLVE